MEFLLIWILFGIASAMVMASKGRSGCAGMLLGFILGPFGLIIAFVAKKDEKVLEMKKIKSGDNKKCPFCAEVVKKEAIICKHCGKDLPPPLPMHMPKEEIEIEIETEGECSKCGHKKCPACAELIKLEAKKCRFCGENFDPNDVAQQVAELRNENSFENRVLCSDGNCIGVIGADGKCKVCGQVYNPDE